MTPEEFDALCQAARRSARDRAYEIAVALLGKPTSATKHELRWGKKGSLALTLTGSKAGLWHDFERGIGGDMLDLIMSERRCPFRDAVASVDASLFDHDEDHDAPPSRARSDDADKKRWSPEAEHLWRHGQILDRGRVAYFDARQLALPTSDDVRFLPHLFHGPTRTWRPALVCRVTNFVTAAPTTLHFTWLSDDGRTRLDKRFMRGHVARGGVVRLTDDADVTTHLGIAEGLETALAVTAGLGAGALWLPIWAALSAGTMASLPVLAGVERLTVFADGDSAGLNAAHALAARWRDAGREVFLVRPPDGRDWNDA